MAREAPSECDLSLELSHFDRIGCAFVQEGNWVTAMMPVFDGIDQALQESTVASRVDVSHP